MESRNLAIGFALTEAGRDGGSRRRGDTDDMNQSTMFGERRLYVNGIEAWGY